MYGVLCAILINHSVEHARIRVWWRTVLKILNTELFCMEQVRFIHHEKWLNRCGDKLINWFENQKCYALRDKMTSYFRLFISGGLSQKSGPSMEYFPTLWDRRSWFPFCFRRQRFVRVLLETSAYLVVSVKYNPHRFFYTTLSTCGSNVIFLMTPYVLAHATRFGLGLE